MRLFFKKNILSLSICALLGFLYFLLFRFRSLDDNVLASWELVFYVVSTTHVYGYLVAGVIIAFIAAKISPPRQFTAIVLFLASFAVASLFWSIPEFSDDTSRYFTQAKHLELYGAPYFFREWGKTIRAWSDLPAIPFMYGVAFRLFGEYRIVIQIITTTLFSLTISLTYLTGRLLWDEETGFSAAILMLASPYIFMQIPLMLVDVPTMFFLSLTVFLFIKALRQGGIWMSLLSPVAICITFFSKYSTWPMLSVLGIVLVVHVKNKPASRRTTLRNSMIPALVSLIFIAIIVSLKHDVVAGQIRLLADFQGPALKRWVESYLSIFFFQIHPFVTLLTLYSIYLAWIRKDYTYAIIAWLPALAMLFQIKRIRYLLPLFPMIMLMAAYGLREITDKRVARFIVYSAACTSLAVALFAYSPYFKTLGAENLINAGKFVDSIPVKNAEVIVQPLQDDEINLAVLVPILDLATATPLSYHDEPHLPGVDIFTLRSRYTWEYKNPVYYENNEQNKGTALVVILSEPDEQLSPALAERTRAYPHCQVFDKHVDVIVSQTAVRIYW